MTGSSRSKAIRSPLGSAPNRRDGGYCRLGMGRRALVAVLLGGLAFSVAACGASSSPTDGTIAGLQLGTCGPQGPSYPAHTAVVEVLRGAQVVGAVHVHVGTPYSVRVSPGTYVVRFKPEKGLTPGNGDRVTVVSGKSTRADVTPLCPGGGP
jgi:hypothetical protein